MWTDGPQPDAEQELTSRLVSHGVMALVAAGPWSPPPRAARSVWWADTVGSDSLRPAPTTCASPRWSASMPRDRRPVGTLLLDRLARGPLTVVLTTRTSPARSAARNSCGNRWGPSYSIDHILRRL